MSREPSTTASTAPNADPLPDRRHPVLHRLGWWLIGLVAIGLFGIPYIIAAWFLLHR